MCFYHQEVTSYFLLRSALNVCIYITAKIICHLKTFRQKRSTTSLILNSQSSAFYFQTKFYYTFRNMIPLETQQYPFAFYSLDNSNHLKESKIYSRYKHVCTFVRITKIWPINLDTMNADATTTYNICQFS